MKTICRLCLKLAIDGVSFHYTDSSGFSTSSLVKALVPELYLGLSPNPVVCKTCYFHLRQAYVFRLRCLRSENLIGIYIRETKNNENLILLDDVVSFWKKRYKNRSDDLQCNLEEWFGKAGDKPGEPIILNQTASIVGSDNDDISKDIIAEDKIQEDETSDLQKEILKSSEKEKTAECTDDCPDIKECSKFNIFKKKKEKTNKEKTSDKNDDDIIVIEDVAKEFDEFMNKACVETPEETIKIVLDDTESQTSKVKCRSKPLTKIVKVLTPNKRQQSDSSAERSKDTTEMIKLVVDGLSHSSKEQYTAVLKLPPKIPTKQSNIDSEKKNIPQKKTQRRINLICDFDDMDINSFVKELQKDENIKKLGLSNNSFGDCNSYFLKKFIDKSDNSLSFALLPKYDEDKPRRETDVDVANKNTLLVNEDKTETFVDGKNLQKENANEKPQVINEPVEVVKEKCNIEDSMKKNPSVSTTSGNQNEAKFIINDGTEATEPQMGICIKDCPDARLNEEKKDEEKCKKALIENVAEVNSNTKNLERVPILLNNKIEPEKGNPPQPPDPLSSTPQDKPPAIPMPIIRVKPASALQKVRTLNHELWPQKKTINYSEDSLPVLYPLSKPQFHHGLPAKMADVEKRAPIVLNSQLDLHGRIPKEHESSPMPPSKLKESLPMPSSKLKGKRPVLKTYRRKVAGAPQVLKRVNPLTYKALEEMQKLGLIKVVGIVDESQVSERIQQSVSNVTYTVKQGAKMVNFEDFLDNSGHDLKICGDDQENAGDRLGNSGDSTKNCGARQGNSGDRTGDSGDGLGNVIDRKDSRDEKNEFAIDIKEEPLNCAESDVLMNFGDDDRVAESEGETTRSASETSFIDTINSQNDLVKTIMDNIPEVGEEQYDVPEYVHINNVTFSDLTKLMGESKIHRENAVKTQMQPPEPKKKVETSERRKLCKYCFVPSCVSNSKQNQKKIFIKVPVEEKVQKKWYAAVGQRRPRLPSRTFCCEDHFDAEDFKHSVKDTKQIGILATPKLKNGILPHKFLARKNPGSMNNDKIFKPEQLGPEVKNIETPNQCEVTLIEKPDTPDIIIKEPAEPKLRVENEEKCDPKTISHGVRYCFVPGCSTNSRQHPNKLYALVPREKTEQKLWFETFNLPFYKNIRYYCCEDHFTIIPGMESMARDNKYGGLVPRSCMHLTVPLKTNKPEYIPSKTMEGMKIDKGWWWQHLHESDYLKSCIVPDCNNTVKGCPNKVFIRIPAVEKVRRRWYAALGLKSHPPVADDPGLWCEDHFSIEDICQRYSGKCAFAKNGIVPHKCIPQKVCSSEPPSKRPKIEETQ